MTYFHTYRVLNVYYILDSTKQNNLTQTIQEVAMLLSPLRLSVSAWTTRGGMPRGADARYAENQDWNQI
jgi:hypothetical protein